MYCLNKLQTFQYIVNLVIVKEVLVIFIQTLIKRAFSERIKIDVKFELSTIKILKVSL